jgi:hypothetical protein
LREEFGELQRHLRVTALVDAIASLMDFKKKDGVPAKAAVAFASVGFQYVPEISMPAPEISMYMPEISRAT